MPLACRPRIANWAPNIESTAHLVTGSTTPVRHRPAPGGTQSLPCRAWRRAAATQPRSLRLFCAAALWGDGRGESRQPLRVCIVGGGVVGLTSALRLLQHTAQPGPYSTPGAAAAASPPRPLEVTVVASEFEADTTTAGAAGLWGPYKLSDTPESLINRWGAATYDHLMQLAHSRDADVAGVTLCAVNSLYPEPQPLPFWRDIAYNFQLIDQRMLDSVSRTGRPPSASEPEPFQCGWGYHWNSVVCEGSRYLPWLTAQIEALGGRLQRVPRLSSLGELSCADVVVNAAGLGSRELLGDKLVYPIRGQILRVRAPWVTEAYFFEPFYIIPNRDTVVLGGTGQVGDFSREVSAQDKAHILAGCRRLLPSLAGAEVVSDWVGLRPGRSSLRLELEREGARLADGRVVPVVHNYGHGGAGLTLAWGCAGDVVRLLQEEGVV